MSQYNLERIFKPRRVAVVGASGKTGGSLNASFAAGMPEVGDLAFVTQSGAICTAILGLAFKEQIGFSHFVSIGSMLDVDFGDPWHGIGIGSSLLEKCLNIEKTGVSKGTGC